jgi:hypothetical protein
MHRSPAKIDFFIFNKDLIILIINQNAFRIQRIRHYDAAIY